MNKELHEFCLKFASWVKPEFKTPQEFRAICKYDTRTYDQKTMIDEYIGGRLDVRNASSGQLPDCLR